MTQSEASSTVVKWWKEAPRTARARRSNQSHARLFFKISMTPTGARVINFRENLGRNLGSSSNKADRALYLETFANTM